MKAVCITATGAQVAEELCWLAGDILLLGPAQARKKAADPVTTWDALRIALIFWNNTTCPKTGYGFSNVLVCSLLSAALLVLDTKEIELRGAGNA